LFAVDQIKKLGTDTVNIDEIPRYVLSMFRKRRAEIEKRFRGVIPAADLSAVDVKLVETLLPFQREAVEYVHEREICI